MSQWLFRLCSDQSETITCAQCGSLCWPYCPPGGSQCQPPLTSHCSGSLLRQTERTAPQKHALSSKCQRRHVRSNRAPVSSTQRSSRICFADRLRPGCCHVGIGRTPTVSVRRRRPRVLAGASHRHARASHGDGRRGLLQVLRVADALDRGSVPQDVAGTARPLEHAGECFSNDANCYAKTITSLRSVSVCLSSYPYKVTATQ